ncbi:MAG: 50S ribosomal protein L21e [DPANN group archaeon]|nr:50S ribosomal protein L21e [DPANN group archaeon]
MATRTGGLRRKTRHLMKKHYRAKGKISIRDSLQEFQKGDKVTLAAEPAVQKGLYHRRFHGHVGVIGARKGDCYEIRLHDGNAQKNVIVHPVHLKRIDEGEKA